MDFYTNVCRSRDKILVMRNKVELNKRLQLITDLIITFYLKSLNRLYKSLDGRNLELVNLNSMGGARKFREKYSGVEGFEVHGYDRYVCTYLSDKFQVILNTTHH